MSYYVDIGEGRFREFDNLQEAKELAAIALQSAKDFQKKMGFVPFWGRSLEIRKGKKELGDYMNADRCNQAVLEGTKVYVTLSV